MRRLRKNRAMCSVTLRMPEAAVEDLKRVAPTLVFAGYQPLIRAHIGKGLRIDLARLDEGSVRGRRQFVPAGVSRKRPSANLLARAIGVTRHSLLSRAAPGQSVSEHDRNQNPNEFPCFLRDFESIPGAY
jgi:hypothetical protein